MREQKWIEEKEKCKEIFQSEEECKMEEVADLYKLNASLLYIQVASGDREGDGENESESLDQWF